MKIKNLFSKKAFSSLSFKKVDVSISKKGKSSTGTKYYACLFSSRLKQSYRTVFFKPSKVEKAAFVFIARPFKSSKKTRKGFNLVVLPEESYDDVLVSIEREMNFIENHKKFKKWLK